MAQLIFTFVMKVVVISNQTKDILHSYSNRYLFACFTYFMQTFYPLYVFFLHITILVEILPPQENQYFLGSLAYITHQPSFLITSSWRRSTSS